MSRERILFVTGRLAEFALRRVLEPLAPRAGFDFDVSVLGISVAALMHVDWLLRRLNVLSTFDRVILPGWCQGDIGRLEAQFATRFERGPKDLHDLPRHFGTDGSSRPALDLYDIEIIAEINHAPLLSDSAILKQANAFRDDGADVIDLGCVPGQRWEHVGRVTKLLCAEGYRVSIDSFDRVEVEGSVKAGAELVLSVNSSNVDWAARLDAEVVAIPDAGQDLDSLAATLETLQRHGTRFRVDPVLEPIGFGFAASLARYFEVRRRWPDVEMMMGVGNITELTEVDSAGLNLLLTAICQELGINSVLTTQVINWTRGAVRELDLARRLIHHSMTERVLPKHLDSQLLVLRDPRVHEFESDELERLARQITDPNFRIFIEQGEIHLMNRDGYWRGTDPYVLFEAACGASADISASHAFYLGYEMAKAVTALTLGKQYTQDEALRWGFLTVPEMSHRERRDRSESESAAGAAEQPPENLPDPKPEVTSQVPRPTKHHNSSSRRGKRRLP